MADPLTEKFKTLEEKVKALGPDTDGNLVIKISRRETLGVGGVMRPALVCTIGGASIAHAISPEVWLPRLLGGGRYTLAVFPPGVSTSPIVDGIDTELSGQPYPTPDLDAPKEDGWNGPKHVIYPLPRPSRESTPMVIQSPPGAGSSPSTSVPHTTSLGSGGPNLGAAQQEELRRAHEQYQAQIAALNQRLADEQRRREMDEIRSAQKREVDALKAEMRELLQRAVPPPPPPAPPQQSIGDLVKELLPAVLPVVTAIMASNAERERRAEERQNKVLEALANRPAISPEIKELMEAQRADQLPVTAILQQTAQATAAMASQMLSMAREVAEMQSGPEESAGIKVIREVGNAVQGIMSASTATPPGMKPRRLPKAEGTPVVSAPLAPAPAPTQALGEVVPLRSAAGATPLTLAQIKDLLLQQQDVEMIAQECVKSFETPEFQKALEAAKYDPGEMFKTLMTAEWLMANAAYATSFGQAFMKHGRAAGIFTEEGEEEEENEDV